jgi:hypothetical protein
LAEALDQWFDRNPTTFALQDRVGHGRALHRGFEIVKKLDQLKSDGLATITALLNSHGPVANNERTVSLIRAFEFWTRLADAFHDELLDTDGEAKVWRLLDGIVLALDKTASGRAALDVLLDSSDAGIRASAGAYLIDLLPARVVPMLRDIDQKGGSKSADFGAHWTLLAWEREGKSRFNYLRQQSSA